MHQLEEHTIVSAGEHHDLYQQQGGRLGMVHGASFDVNVMMNGLFDWENQDPSFKVAAGAPAGMECMSEGQLEILAKTDGSLG